MKILDLRDNALFLQNWRERMRQPAIFSGVAITLIILLLIFLSAFYSQDSSRYFFNSSVKFDSLLWLKKSLWQILMLQGALILTLGLWAVNRMSARERRSGTLEFHRNSPTTRLNQALGIILGAPSLEWCLFAIILLFAVPLSLYVGLPFLLLMKFYMSLILTAFFYHSLFVLFTLGSTPKTQSVPSRLPSIFIVIGMYVLIVTMRSPSLSVLYHAFPFPVYDQVWQFLFPSAYGQNNTTVFYLNSWWGIAWPTLILQVLIQVPLLFIIFKGIERKIASPDLPSFSKSQFSVLTFIVFFLFIGSAYSCLLFGVENSGFHRSMNWRAEPIFYFFVCLAYVFGLGGALLAVPQQLSYYKGLLRLKRIGQKTVDFSSDNASHLGWLSAYALIFTVSFLLLSYVFDVPIGLKILVGMNIFIYIASFSGALEYFRLSIYRKKGAIFATLVGVLWVVFPIIAEILKNKVINHDMYLILTSLSPFSRVPLFVSAMTGSNSFNHSSYLLAPEQVLLQGAVVNLILGGVFHVLANRERQKWQILAAKSN